MCYSKILIILAILSSHAIVNWLQEVKVIILRGHRSILSINFLAPLFYSKDWKTRYVENLILFLSLRKTINIVMSAWAGESNPT